MMMTTTKTSNRFIVLLLVIPLVLSGCQDNEQSNPADLIGTWEFYKTVLMDGQDIEFDEPSGIYLQFFENGTMLRVTPNSRSRLVEYTAVVDEGNLLISFKNEETGEFVLGAKALVNGDELIYGNYGLEASLICTLPSNDGYKRVVARCGFGECGTK